MPGMCVHALQVFNRTLQATLVTKGELQWDDRVQKFLGQSFALGPHSYVSEVLKIRHDLVHNAPPPVL